MKLFAIPNYPLALMRFKRSGLKHDTISLKVQCSEVVQDSGRRIPSLVTGSSECYSIKYNFVVTSLYVFNSVELIIKFCQVSFASEKSLTKKTNLAKVDCYSRFG